MDVQTKIISFPAPSTPGKGVTSGWDPYEVWRTRVLLPRLAESGRVSHETVETLDIQAQVPVVHAEDASVAVALLSDRTTAVTDQALVRQLVGVMGWLLAAAVTRSLLPTAGSSARYRRP